MQEDQKNGANDDTLRGRPKFRADGRSDPRFPEVDDIADRLNTMTQAHTTPDDDK